MSMSNEPTTPREARLLLNQLEAWFHANSSAFTQDQRRLATDLFEHAFSPLHAIILRDELRRWLQSSNQASQPVESSKEAIADVNKASPIQAGNSLSYT